MMKLNIRRSTCPRNPLSRPSATKPAYDLLPRFTLHGAVDVQGWLQRTTPAAIEAEVNRLMDEVGNGGGYILAPSHNIQPDTPLENVLAVYETVAKRRGKSILVGR